MFAIEAMRAQLVDVVREVRGGTDLLATAPGEIAAGNQELSMRTEQQAGAQEETASLFAELTSTVRRVNVLPESASGAAAHGGAGSEHDGVDRGVGREHRRHNQHHQRHRVPDQLFALNAAVEATCDGEQSRGFAVVASEVRTLAEHSAEAVKRVKNLIDRSIQETDAGSW